jgi:hypothetical protein
MGKIIIIFISCLFFFSCAAKYAKDEPCGGQCEQAKKLLAKITEDPYDIIEIMEEEKCIDCKHYIKYLKKNKHYLTGDIKLFERIKETNSEIGCEDTAYNTSYYKYVLTLGVGIPKDPERPNNLIYGAFYFSFLINDNGSLTLKSIYSPI